MADEMRFSYCMLPDYPLDDAIGMIKTADELGFYACYSVDETWHKDLWVLFGAAARETERIRFGPNVTHVFLREPTLIVQALATLDEMSNGRAECVVSTGNFGLLAQYNIDWEHSKPLSRLKEALHVMRTFLDEGAITFEGDFFKYSGLYTFARPVQERLPIKMGAMKGPRSFQAAGELADGMHQALAYSREAYDYSSENLRIGAERAGRNWQDLDNGAWVVTVVSEDSAAPSRPPGSSSRSTSPRCPKSSSPVTASTPRSCSPSWTPSAPETSRRRSSCSRPNTRRSCRWRARRRRSSSRSARTSRRPASTT
jgi:5,10-methylenetetrahydromethanopterin reductase